MTKYEAEQIIITLINHTDKYKWKDRLIEMANSPYPKLADMFEAYMDSRMTPLEFKEKSIHYVQTANTKLAKALQ